MTEEQILSQALRQLPTDSFERRTFNTTRYIGGLK